MELLAPAGGREAAFAALSNGADAIYLGLGDFNARRNAENFTFDDLEEVCRIAHIGEQRVYLTVNTALKRGELRDALELVSEAWARGIDAVIVQDLGLFSRLRSEMPEVAVHVSTQMNIHDSNGVSLLRRMGAERVTLARELGVDEIARLSKLGVELEVFGHGALCVCYSGQCLMSSLIGQRSANRGLCAQACRLPYELIDGAGNLAADPAKVGRYLLSPKDLATIDILPALIDAGVGSLKVEGRMKSPEYVATVTSVYRAAIDRAAREPEGYAATTREHDDLAEAFSRGFTTAYLGHDRTMAMMGPKRPNNRGVRVGRVTALGGGFVTLTLEKDVARGDVLEYWTSRGAVPEKVEALFIDGREVDAAPAGSQPKLVVSKPVSPNDRVFRVQNTRLATAARESYEGFVGRSVPVRFAVRLVTGEPITVEATDAKGRVGRAEGPVAEPARTKAVSANDIREHVGRLGGTPFEACGWEIDCDGAAGAGFSLLHRLRREALEDLEHNMLADYEERTKPQVGELGRSFERPASKGLVSVLCSARNAPAIASVYGRDPAVRLEVPAVEVAFGRPEDADSLRALLDGGAALMMPTICHDEEADALLSLVSEGATVIADSVSMLDACARRGAVVEAGPHIPLWNPDAIDAVRDLGATRAWMSPELALSELCDLATDSSLALGVTAYGAQELMVMEHCQLMAAGPCAQTCPTCIRRREAFSLRDRKGYEFPVRTDARGRTHLFNSVVLDAVPNVPELYDAGVKAVRVDATLLEPEDALRAIARCREALVSGTQFDRQEHTTTGNLFRPVR